MAGTVPAGRAAHSACLIEPGGSIVVFGGTNGQRPFDELWLLHVHSSRWEQLRLPSSLHKPTARSYHSAAVVGGEMLIWGGVRPGRDEGCRISATLTPDPHPRPGPQPRPGPRPNTLTP